LFCLIELLEQRLLFSASELESIHGRQYVEIAFRHANDQILPGSAELRIGLLDPRIGLPVLEGAVIMVNRLGDAQGIISAGELGVSALVNTLEVSERERTALGVY
jgi:hypothetical protein